MNRYNAITPYVYAVRITDEMIDAPPPSTLHVTAVVYDPTVRTARVPDGAVGRAGDWLVVLPLGRLTVMGNGKFTLSYYQPVERGTS